MGYQPRISGTNAKQGSSPTGCYQRGYAGSYGYYQSIDIRESLQSLLENLTEYDSLRLTLEREGGGVGDLRSITKLLNKPVLLATQFGTKEVALTKQGNLRDAVNDVDFDLYLDIRQLQTRMPVYYLCRARRDYWGEYSLIVEDYYMSPGYPMTDERFVKLMQGGHEIYYLRISQFRECVTDMAEMPGSVSTKNVDGILYDLGRHVLQAAWHEDQRLGVMAAIQFGLPSFHQVIELLYLCLSGELCELRSAVNETMLQFFEEAYRQPAIRAFLGSLTRLDGEMLNDLPQRARSLYRRLSQAFSRFLSIEVTWGYQKLPIPLWKLIYANLSRMDQVAAGLKGDTQLEEATIQLEQEAEAVIKHLLELPS